MMRLSQVKSLYEKDFILWIEETVEQLKLGNFSEVDLENLIEEIESLGKRDKRELKSCLITLFEHLLKRQYIDLPECYRGWDLTIKRTQSQLKDILRDSPSLRNLFTEIYLDCYQEAVENMTIEYEVNFPEIYPFSQKIDELLS